MLPRLHPSRKLVFFAVEPYYEEVACSPRELRLVRVFPVRTFVAFSLHRYYLGQFLPMLTASTYLVADFNCKTRAYQNLNINSVN